MFAYFHLYIANKLPQTDLTKRERRLVRELQRNDGWRKLLLKQQKPQRGSTGKPAPQSVVDLLKETERGEGDWLQQPGEHTFNDEMNGISPEDRKKMDADDFGDGIK